MKIISDKYDDLRLNLRTLLNKIRNMFPYLPLPILLLYFANRNGVFAYPYCSHYQYSYPDSLKRHLQKLKTNTTKQTNNESGRNKNCMNDNIGEDNIVAVILDTEVTK